MVASRHLAGVGTARTGRQRRPVRAPSGAPQFCRATHMAQPLRRLAAPLRTHTRDSQLEPATRQGGSPVVWRLPISQPYSLKLRDRFRTPPPPSAGEYIEINADGGGLVSGVRVSFTQSTMDGRDTSAESGGWGAPTIRGDPRKRPSPTGDVPTNTLQGTGRARKAPTPYATAPNVNTQRYLHQSSFYISYASLISILLQQSLFKRLTEKGGCAIVLPARSCAMSNPTKAVTSLTGAAYFICEPFDCAQGSS